MKRTNTYISAALVLLLGLAACNKTEPENTDLNNGQIEDVAGTPIVFTATGLSSNTATTATTGTRATVDGDWENVNSVGVMIDGTVKKYSVTANPIDNTKATLSSTDPHYWSTNHDTLTVTAWWPYTDDETSMPDVVVKENQSTEDDFKASDFISAVDQKVAYSSSTLKFTHRTARVIIELTDYTEGLTSVKLTNLSNENDNPQEIIPYEYAKAGDNITYVALVAPQTVAEGTAFITYGSDNGRTFIYKKQNDASWEAGKEYTYTVSTPDYSYSAATKTYTVYNANGLLAWNKAVQDSLWLNCTLAADIDLTNITYEWLLVGDYDYPYTGTFEGGNHTITGLTVNYSSTICVGLIGSLGSDGNVQNLTLDNVSITGYNNVGGVVGGNYGGTVTNCSVSGSVSGRNNVGGVVGANSNGTVTNCSASGSVIGSSNRVGGVVGENDYGTVTNCNASGDVTGSGSYVGGVVGQNTSGTVTGCSASGKVSSTYSGEAFVGGIVGYNYGTNATVTSCTASGSVSGASMVGGVAGRNYQGTMTDCNALGDVTGSGTFVGGVVGQNYSGTVTGCTATGKVSSTYSGDETYVGGVVGYNYGSSSSVTGCTASGDVEAYDRIGGVAGRNEGTVTNCSASGNVTGNSSNGTRIGGVVGDNQGTMIASYASGNVTGSSFVGGVAGWINGSMVACYASGNVTGSNHVGGVVGYIYTGSTTTACYHVSGTINANGNVGGVVGSNYGTVTACYWDNNMGSGIGTGSGGNTTQVDTWEMAVTRMNSAISTWNGDNSNQCKWEYEYQGESTPPILTEVEE